LNAVWWLDEVAPADERRTQKRILLVPQGATGDGAAEGCQCDDAHEDGRTRPVICSGESGFRENVTMAPLRSTPTAKGFPAKFAEREHQCRLAREVFLSVATDHGVAIAVAPQDEWVAPLRLPIDAHEQAAVPGPREEMRVHVTPHRNADSVSGRKQFHTY
jgi:hypothetical protein